MNEKTTKQSFNNKLSVSKISTEKKKEITKIFLSSNDVETGLTRV